MTTMLLAFVWTIVPIGILVWALLTLARIQRLLEAVLTRLDRIAERVDESAGPPAGGY